MPTIINISNRLPVVIDDGQVKKSSGGLVSALEGLTRESNPFKWIGWTGKAVEDPDQRRKFQAILAKDPEFVPVFLTEKQVSGHYGGFSNSSLWPLLHYMPSKFKYEREWWDQYVQANQLFAEAALSVAKEGDLVWVHDYQLMLLPAMLKKEMPSLKVGFFLHTPFPSSEVFRWQPRRQELLEGLIEADQIGFHTFAYLRNFRGAVARLLGAETHVTSIHREDHTAYLGVYPIGINAGKFLKTLQTAEYEKELADLRESHGGKRVVFSVERLDYTKGILHRLEAIDLFLQERKDRDNIRFIFVSVPSRETVDEYKELREDVEARVGRLNGKYSTLHNTPLHFIHGSVDFTRLCAMYALSEVAMVTPLIDGMNLVAKEFIACQEKEPGVLVLSEFAGAAEELFNALIVNPYDAKGVADALSDALEMNPEERSRRMSGMRQRVMECDANWWAELFIKDLDSRKLVTPTIKDNNENVAGARRRIAGTLRAGRKAAFFLDYDGSLRELERDPDTARPHVKLVELFDKLASAPGLDVAIVSGRRAYDMERWLGKYPFALVAEHGAEIRRPHGHEWERLDRHISYDWKPEVLRVLQHYRDLTPGSFIEEKRTGLVWHYRKADNEFGYLRASKLAEELSTILANEPVVIRHGKKIVEIAATHVSKGAAVARLIDETHPDLALCAGDDQTDETMFDLREPALITIKIGTGPTKAQMRIPSPADFRRFLWDALPAMTPAGSAT